MFSLQVTMFIICSQIRFLVKRERFTMSCLFVCSLLSVAFSLSLSLSISTAFYFHTRSLKDESKCVRAREKSQISLLFYVSLNFFSILKCIDVHIANSLLLLPTAAVTQLCVYVECSGVKFLLPNVPLEFLTAPKLC